LTPVDPKAIALGEGELVIDFAEAFGVITKDSIAGRQGSPLVLREWQKQLIRNIYAGDGQDGFQARLAYVGMPRKSGKSALM